MKQLKIMYTLPIKLRKFEFFHEIQPTFYWNIPFILSKNVFSIHWVRADQMCITINGERRICSVDDIYEFKNHYGYIEIDFSKAVQNDLHYQGNFFGIYIDNQLTNLYTLFLMYILPKKISKRLFYSLLFSGHNNSQNSGFSIFQLFRVCQDDVADFFKFNNFFDYSKKEIEHVYNVWYKVLSPHHYINWNTRKHYDVYFSLRSTVVQYLVEILNPWDMVDKQLFKFLYISQKL